jgi:hypothetical protein
MTDLFVIEKAVAGRLIVRFALISRKAWRQDRKEAN